MAVREPAGNIYIEEHDLASGKKKNGWLNWPIARGCRAFLESLVLGYKALETAALHAYAEDSSDDSAGAHAGDVISNDRRELDASGAPSLESNGAVLDTQESDVNLPSEKKGERAFSWKDDFGNPDEMIDALGAQRSLDVVSEPVEGARLGAAQAVGGTAEAAVPPKTDNKAADTTPEAHEDDSGEFGKKEMAVSMALGLVLGVVLFVMAPALIANLLVGEYDSHTLVWNIVDGIVRVAIFIFYIWLIGRMKDINRMFGYHGAEHKTIHCFEHGLPLTPENARSFPRLHVRCGTAFLIMVMIIAIFVYTIIPLNAVIAAWGVPEGPLKLALVIVVRILFMPIIAGISYEITVKWAGSHPENPLVKIILWPGMQMQRLTTREPDDSQIECAIAAMKKVLEREEREAQS